MAQFKFSPLGSAITADKNLIADIFHYFGTGRHLQAKEYLESLAEVVKDVMKPDTALFSIEISALENKNDIIDSCCDVTYELRTGSRLDLFCTCLIIKTNIDILRASDHPIVIRRLINALQDSFMSPDRLDNGKFYTYVEGAQELGSNGTHFAWTKTSMLNDSVVEQNKTERHNFLLRTIALP